MTLRETVFPALLLLCVLTAGAADVNAALTPQENWNVVLTPVVTEFHEHAGLDHHQPSRKLILSANTAAGESHSFELLAGDGGHSAFSNVAGLQGDVLVATARDDGQGVSRGGFQPGTLFASTGAAGVVARISADGASVQNPWVVLPDEAQITGLHLDRTGVFGGDLLVVTAAGGVWRVSASATPTRLAALDTRLAGVAVVPDDVLAYGPWAGKVLAGAKELGSVYAINAQGQSVPFAVGLNPQDIDIVPAHENFYAIDHTSRKLLGAAEGALTGIIGDILVTQESPGRVSRVRWDGTGFVVAALAEAPGLKQVAFSPAGAGAIPAVKQVYEKIAVVRHAPQLDSGRIDGTLWQLTGEDTSFDGTDTITSDLLVPGTPTVTAAASSSYGGTIDGTESAAPTGYKVTLAGKASLRHVVTRTAPIALQEVAFPPAPQGTRDVQLRKATDTIGDPATLRHLDIAGNAGSVAVPPGTYGKFTISGRNTLVLGVDGSTAPAVYNLEQLALTGGSSLRVAGPVTLRVRNAVTLVGSSVGAADDPKRLRLEVAPGRPADAVQVSGNGVLYAIVRAPRGKISIQGNGRLRGTVACDLLQVDGNGVLQITENDLPPPPVNRPPTVSAGPDHTITLPIDTVALEGTASDDGLPAGSTLSIVWTKVSGPGPVAFAAAENAATSATFSLPGEYVLKLTATDGQLLSSDTVAVTVIPRNQPPVVDAGEAQTIELPAPAELHGTVTDDGLPPGTPLEVTWIMAEGPGEVTFADAQAAVTTASFSATGVYTLRLTTSDTEFTVTDDVVVTVLKNVAPTVDAGLDATIALPVDTVALEGTATDDGLPLGSALAVTWTTVSGPGPVTFAEGDKAAASATFSIPGEYVLKLTATDGQLLSSDTVAITVIPRNQAPVVDAGEEQTIELPAPAELHGSVTDDPLPRGASLAVIWSMTEGPGEVTFADEHAAVTTASFSAPGVYTLRLRADDTEFTVEDDVVVTVLKNAAPSVDAGFDATITLPVDTLALEGTATDDGLPAGSSLAVTWTKVSGAGEVTFGDAQSAATSATFSLDGVYELQLTASDGALSSSDTITVTVIPRNEPPVVDAGPAQTIQLPAMAELLGTVTDDGLPRGSDVSVTWSAEGPGPVTFGDRRAAVTTASCTTPGVYTLRLSASDTELTVSDDVVVTVLQNLAPSVNAGADQAITFPSNVLLSGTASDDGYPAGSRLEVFWTKVSGPGSVIFHDAFAATTPVTITSAGTYVLRLTASDSELSAADELTVVVHPRPNQPPQITSDAPTEYLLGAVPTGGGEIVNLAPWTVVQYRESLTSPRTNAVWQKATDNTSVTQTINADPSALLSDFNLSNAQMEGTWKVNTTNDDDYIGFVFGYQDSGHFYLFDWKQGNQDVAGLGMSLKVVSADSELTGLDFWPTAGNARVRPLYHNTVRWVDGVQYQFTLQFHPGEIRIIVKQGATVLADFTVKDSTYTNGKFGFYNYSQAAVQYSGFRRLSLARGTYTYDVEATDVDGDALTYSLTAAPLGMTIDPATGLITWPVSSAVAGDHPVSVRVQTPDGRFDTQSYTLTILSPNEPPAVNAGDNRLITTGATAILNGTATDDGFPRNSTLGVSWSTVSGPGTVTFANAALANTNATFSKSGSYLLRLSATDSELSASDEVTVTVNTPPVVNAGADQTLAQSNTTVLTGTVTDDGVPSGQAVSIVWEQTSGPGSPSGVTFDNAGSSTTRAIFPGPGTYTLRLTGNDSLHAGADSVTVIVNASPALDGATLSLVAGNGGPYATGTSQPLRATLRNSTGSPLANYGVHFAVTGANPTLGSAVTDAAGVATFSYTGANVGTDSIRASVKHTTVIESPAATITWAQAPTSPPATQGWIGDPRDGHTVTGMVAIKVATGVTLTQATVEYWPASNPSAVTVLATGAQGGSGATLAALDTTLLANGNYVIRLSATDADGQLLVSQVLITVFGENKPGRVTLSVTDLTVPVTGIPITIAREYDSLLRNEVGDFGHGWSLEMAGPRLQVSPDYDVTITEPATGRRVTFQFAPTAFGFPFTFLSQPAYVPEPRIYGKLTANGCGTLVRTSSGVSCYLASDPVYRPTTYTYTDPYGRVYTMTAAGKLVSIRNLDGNVLTFSASGISSSAGNLTVSFERDSQGRITDITDPTGKVYGYNYDAVGDLVSVELPGTATPLRYEYAPGHYFLKGTDARGNAEATNTYYADGRLQSVTDAQGKTTSYAYDLANRTTTITHPDGTGATIETYDPDGLVLSTIDPLGRKTSYTYDANRNMRTETDALNKTTTYDYDANGHLKSVTDPLNKTQLVTNNQFGQPVSATDQLGKTHTLKYDVSQNPSSVSDELGTQVAVSWSERGNPLTFTDANGKVTHFTYDAYGNILSKTDPLGGTTSYTYDTMGRVLTRTDPRGVTRFAYDEMGRMLSVIDPLSNKTRYEYDANGNRTAVIDAKGRTTGYEYDAANRVSKITYPDGTTHSYTYDFRGQKKTETVAGLQVSRTTTYDYDDAGQLVKITHPDGSEIKRTYDEIGRLKTVTDELDKTVTYEYDPNCGCRDRLAKITDHNGNTTTYTYDAAGRRISFRDAANRETRYTYDVRNRLTKTTFADSTFTETTFDGLGRPLATTDQEGRVTRYAYDEVGNLLSVTGADGATTQYTYDTQKNLLSSTDANGNTTRFEYDALNRLIKRVLPLGMTELYTYDEIGNRVTRTDFRGKQTSYEFDPLNRPTARRPDPSLGEPAVTYSYTATGMRRSMTDASGTTAYTYDQRDRLLTKQTPQGTLTYTHNAAGRLTSMRSSNAGGIWVDYTYDDLHRLESVIDHRLAAGTTAYSYDVVGNLKSDLRPNGVRADYTYDALNRLANLGVTRAGTTQASYGYTLDRTGRRLSVTEGGGRKVNYTYDAANRLTREAVSGNPNGAGNGVVDYTVDLVGNRLSRVSSLEGVLSATSVYDANDRLVSDAYDANGNARGAGGQTFGYDFENRITSAGNGAVRITYDGDGNLAAKTVGGVTTRYLVDDLNPTGYSQVVEEIVNGQVERQYTYGHTILSQRRRAGGWAASFYSADGHGSIRQLTDETGTITDTYTYDAFGKLISSAGTTPNAYLYAGERFDEDLGLYHLRARYYNADRGRFFSMDPHPGKIDNPVSLHKYLYANADPVNFTDPTGLIAAFDYGKAVVFLAGRLAVRRSVTVARVAAERARLEAIKLRIAADTKLTTKTMCLYYLALKLFLTSLGPDGADMGVDAMIERFCS
jgi:RHS repeat-associated protein